ncbi:MAG: hypothetical protein HY364_04195 [Candidatus Aenigmarchaeota archaeon]|nr:hypothetical protein [Candidatus Aenigmarchaeota archaeon]
MAYGVDWDKIIAQPEKKRNKHRNAIIALAFLAIITMAGYYLAPEEGNGPLQSTTVTTSNDLKSDPCDFYLSDNNGVTCNEGLIKATERYPGTVKSATLTNSDELGMPQSGIPYWRIVIALSSPLTYGDERINGEIEVLVDRSQGRARLYKYSSA